MSRFPTPSGELICLVHIRAWTSALDSTFFLRLFVTLPRTYAPAITFNLFSIYLNLLRFFSSWISLYLQFFFECTLSLWTSFKMYKMHELAQILLQLNLYILICSPRCFFFPTFMLIWVFLFFFSLCVLDIKTVHARELPFYFVF